MIKFSNRTKLLIYVFFSSILLFNFYRFLDNNLANGNEFQIAGWLINYNHGFTRRGLFGSLIINFLDSPFSLNLFLALILSLLYLYIVLGILKIFFSNDQNLISIIILFSPAFYLYNFWDFTGSYRKEILGIAVIVYLLKNLKSSNQIKIILISTFLLNFSIYSSEVNLFFIFSFWYILKTNFKEVSLILKNALVFGSVLTFFVIYFFNSLIFNSNLFIGSKLCNQLISIGYDSKICDGALYYLDLSTVDTVYRTLNYVSDSYYDYRIYVFLFIYFFIPLLLDKNFYRQNNFVLLNFINFIPLFLIANDWGRWFYIFFVITGLNYLVSEKNRIEFNINKVSVLFITIYLTSYRLNHCCIEKSDPLFLNLLPFNHIFQYLLRLIN
mgnify:CR=1 FL=1